MKFSTALTSLILIVPLFTGEALGAAAIGRANGGNGGNKGAAAGAGKGAAGAGKGAGAGAGKGAAQNGTAAGAGAGAANNTAALGNTGAANSTGAANATGAAAAATGAGAANASVAAAAGANGNDQTSLTLNPAVIAKGFAENGQETPAAGQVASLTSTNNFINFCLTTNKPLTNGQQIKTGSCNPAPMGVIAATTNMPAAKFVNPVNGQNIQANTAFNIQMAVNNLETGNFVNADANYYSAPQQVNAQGDIVGHTHFTVQAVPSFTSTTPLDSTVFAFFKGVNSAAQNGVVSEAVTSGLPAGTYRLCSINTDANHTPCLVAVAQHGSLDDCVYFSVGGSGNNAFGAGSGAANGTAGAAGAAGNATGAASAAGNATSSAPPAAGSSAAAAGKGAAAGAGAGKGAAAGAGAGKGAAAGAGKGAGAGAGKGAGAGAAGNAGQGGRKAGGRRVSLGYRESRLGRDY